CRTVLPARQRCSRAAWTTGGHRRLAPADRRRVERVLFVTAFACVFPDAWCVASCRSDYSCSAACDGPGCPTRGTVWFEAPGSAARRAEPVKQLHGSVQYYGLIHSRAGESCLSVVTTHAAAIPARLTSHLPAPHASALLPQPGSAN